MAQTDPTDQLLDHLFEFPYLPGLGPVHPDEVRPRLWAAVLENNSTGRHLPYDRAGVWGRPKTDRILTDVMTIGRDHVFVPVLNSQGSGTIDLFCYGTAISSRSKARDQAAKLAADQDASSARLRWFTTTPEPDAECAVRIHLKTLDSDLRTATDGSEVDVLDNQPPDIRSTFDSFAEAAGEGFPYLVRRRESGIDDGPILTISHDGRIIGAIGPMRTLPDSIGRIRLCPQYFAVLPEHQARGYGRALWNAAMHWGSASGATYQILQTELDNPSDLLCQSDGCTTLVVLQSERVLVTDPAAH